MTGEDREEDRRDAACRSLSEDLQLLHGRNPGGGGCVSGAECIQLKIQKFACYFWNPSIWHSCLILPEAQAFFLKLQQVIPFILFRGIDKLTADFFIGNGYRMHGSVIGQITKVYQYRQDVIFAGK